MGNVLIHGAFDVLAWLAAGLAALWLGRVEKVSFPAVTIGLPYLAAVLLGAGMGAYVFGTANLWLSGAPGIARSIEGAVAGGIIAVELYKRGTRIRMRTGARFALPLAVGVAVGRLGCYFAGLDDFTYGTSTASRAIRCSSTKAPPWRVSRCSTWRPCACATLSSSTTASISRSAGTERNDSCGSSSSPMGA
jgi:hypothetical protein